MAEAKTSSKQSGLTRWKAIAIAVLAVVLVVVLYVQFGMSSEKTTSALAAYRPPRPPSVPQPAVSDAKAAPATPAKKPTGKDIGSALIINETHWKPPALAAVTAYDPFALPPGFPQPPKAGDGSKSDKAENLIAAAAADDAKKLADALEQLHMQLEELTQRGVHVIVRERDEYGAMIGDRMVHVGDEINGFTITAIDPDGVHVERKESP